MRRLRKPYTVESEGGVAEPLAAVLLIAVIALGIGALAVALFSQQPPPVLPSVTFDVSYSDSGSVAIRHDGGETIPRDQLQIYIDNGTVVQDNRAFYKGDERENWTNWSIGDILTYTPPEAANGPQKAEVLMVYSDLSGGEYLLYASEGWKGQVPGTATPPPTVTVTPTGTTTPTPTATVTPTGTATSTPTTPVIPTETATPTPTTLVADFTANITSGQAPLAVAFTDTSTGGPTSWSWDFGDGSTSTEQNPVHTYTNEGLYTVTLTVENAHENDTVKKTAYIIVTEEHVSRLEVNSVRQMFIFFWWYAPVNGITIDYAGDLGTGADTTPFVLSKTDSGDSGFTVTLTAPDEIQVQVLIFPITMDFYGWRVGDTWYESTIISVPVAEDESRTATAFYI
ncbi:PKD domain-containing protein [Methanoculleus receptaculi]|uniref:PKD domain-containing protein n=1 Tax=Methanoculleus receptaculi TaxID=394967 RepID=A0AAX4FTU3_9EURY|nr:PKD domain-containing protein [Methanoculleus receptaculi]WOX57352.1 PKD domain-containing protein [Methanoculleus receptaculi]